MQTTENCLIEQLFIKIQVSALSEGSDLSQFLSLLKETLSSLLENASQDDCKILKKDGALSLLELPEAKSLLISLGFKEEGNQYVYYESDENFAKLQRCLSLVNDHLANKAENGSCDDLASSPSTSLSPAMSPEHGSSRHNSRSTGGSMKELFLAKHLKKEQLDGMAILQKNNRRHSSNQTDFTFNNSGYFHQSCNNSSKNTNARRNRLMNDFFHQESHNSRGWCSSGLNTKMV